MNLASSGGILLAALDVLAQPLEVGLVAREGGDEFLARHAGIAHADHHDLLLELAHLADVQAQLLDQRFEHARRQLQFHELGGGLGALLERLRILGAQLGDAGHALTCSFASEVKRRAASSGSGPVSTASSVSPSPSASSVSVSAVSSTSSILVGILRLRDDVRRVGIDEADDHVDQAALAGLDQLDMP